MQTSVVSLPLTDLLLDSTPEIENFQLSIEIEKFLEIENFTSCPLQFKTIIFVLIPN